MVNFNNIVIKYGSEMPVEIGKNLKTMLPEKQVTEITKTASNCISNIQRGIISIKNKIPKLNRYSVASEYFGVYSSSGILKQLDNQMALSLMKTRDENLVNFPSVILPFSNVKNAIAKAISKLKEQKFGRITVTDKLFGENGQDGTHTIGLVYHKGKYILLDSIPESYPEVKDFHERLLKFLEINPNDIIISNKSQQGLQEYTCNNWTHANLDAVFNYLKLNGAESDITPEILDKILPEDINKILAEQVGDILKELKGRNLQDLIMELCAGLY